MYYDKADFDKNVVTFNDRIEEEKVNITLAWARSLTKKVTA